MVVLGLHMIYVVVVVAVRISKVDDSITQIERAQPTISSRETRRPPRQRLGLVPPVFPVICLHRLCAASREASDELSSLVLPDGVLLGRLFGLRFGIFGR